MPLPIAKYDLSFIEGPKYDVSDLPGPSDIAVNPDDIYDPSRKPRPGATIGRVTGAFGVGLRESVRRKASSVRFNIERSGPRKGDSGAYQPRAPYTMFSRENDAQAYYEALKPAEKLRIDTESMRLQLEEGYSESSSLQQALIIRAEKRKQNHIDAWRKVERAKMLQTPEEYQSESSGLAEDVLRAIGGSAIDVGLMMGGSMAGGPVGALLIGGGGIFQSIHGGTVELLERYDVPPDRIETAALLNAAVQTPLEFLGNMIQVGKILKPRGTWGAFVRDLGESFLGEGVTEFAQSFPDQFITAWALNPDLSASELLDFISVHEAAYEGLVGGLAGTGTAGAGITTRAGIERLIAPKQRRINEQKRNRIDHLLDKGINGDLSIDDSNELGSMLQTSGDEINKIFSEVTTRPDEPALGMSFDEYIDHVKTQDKAGIDYAQDIQIEETGKTVKVKKDAAVALKEIDNKIDIYQKIMDCIA